MTNRSLVLITSTFLVTALAACGGGSGASGVAYPGIPGPTSQPTTSPTAQPTASPAPTSQATANPTPTNQATANPTPTPTISAPLGTATINGRVTFITAAKLPVYIYTSDTPGHSTCGSALSCLAAWPLVPAPPGALPAPFTSFTRSDNNQVQLQYNGQPLYTFVADSADTANGDGSIVGAGTFKLAHPIGD
jgi:predicted lipoprotein with Yx(FWY)xxD motif